MKMTKEDYELVLNTVQANKELARKHYENVKAHGDYNVLEVRVAWDVCKHLLGLPFILSQYDKGLHDKHMTTAFVKALKTVLD